MEKEKAIQTALDEIDDPIKALLSEQQLKRVKELIDETNSFEECVERTREEIVRPNVKEILGRFSLDNQALWLSILVVKTIAEEMFESRKTDEQREEEWATL